MHHFDMWNCFSADLLTVEPHTPTPEPEKYDKKDGQWYTHDGVDVKETQSRKSEEPCTNSSTLLWQLKCRRNTTKSGIFLQTYWQV